MKYQANFWNKYFKTYDILLNVIPYQELFKEITKSLSAKSNMKVLDLGAGTGNLQYFLDQNQNVVSLDNSEEALKRLKEKFPNANIIKHSVTERLPFDDNTFDRIVSNNVLYTLHHNQWTTVVQELHRICKPNGIVVISNLNKSFQSIKIYKDHLKKSIQNEGLLKTIRQATALIIPTLRMLWYNSIIKNNDTQGQYSFVNKEEQKNIFSRYGFASKQDTKSVYSHQANLDVFVKLSF